MVAKVSPSFGLMDISLSTMFRLVGVKSVTLHDEGSVELWDLSSNFVFTENDIGKNRALASVQKLQELNNAVVVTTLFAKLTKEQLADFQARISGGNAEYHQETLENLKVGIKSTNKLCGVEAMGLNQFVSFLKTNKLEAETFFIGHNEYLVTSIHESWFCARCINTSKPAGEGAIVWCLNRWY